jgi:putative ATPase
MTSDALWEPEAPATAQTHSFTDPLAVRMRPQTLDDLIGQEHLLGAGSPLRSLVEGDAPISVILWGPPGSGKTTIASIVSRTTSRRFVQLSALNSGVKDIRAVIEEAERARDEQGLATVLFVDEIHRFSKVPQEGLLGAVENRIVALVAATTENPSFSVVPALLSRSLLLRLQPLERPDLLRVIEKAVSDPRGLGGEIVLQPDAASHIADIAEGDARYALTVLEAAASAAQAGQTVDPVIDLGLVERTADRATLRYDTGDARYDTMSAFIKSMRGSDPHATMHYLARMIESGEDPRYIARRLMVHASEDVGLADPTALTAAVNAAQVVQMVGLPEARLALAQAALHIATAPKSNAVMSAIDEASGDVRAGLGGLVPIHLRDAHYPGAKKLGHGAGYRYPHDEAHGVAAQQYLPDEVADRQYYRPVTRGLEGAIKERLARIMEIIRGRQS